MEDKASIPQSVGTMTPKPKQKISKWIIISMVILTLLIFSAYFFFPKPYGSGGICYGCEVWSCKCLGIRTTALTAPAISMCYGMPYDCTPKEIMHFK